MDPSRTSVWLEEPEELTLELSSQCDTASTISADHTKKYNNHHGVKSQDALHRSWVRSPLGFVKKKEKAVDTQEGLGREWVRGPLGWKLYTRKK